MQTPLVVFALDSADPDLLLRWSRDGTLPTLAGLLARGAHARVAGPEMLSAHGVWPSMWSGLSLSEHGRYLRRPLRPGGYDLLDDHEALRAAPPFWAPLRDRRVIVLDAPDATPVAGLAGVQLLNWGIHPSGPRPVSVPADLVAEIEQRFGPPIRSDETQGTRSEDRRIYRRILERVARQGAVARHLLEGGFDLALVGFGDAHAAGHRFWRFGLATTARVEDDGLRDAVREVYRAIDRELGRILAAVPRDAHVVVLSDHGIREGYPTWELMSAFCHRLGYQAAHQDGRVAAARRALRATWQRVRPRLRLASNDAAARTLAETDWSRTAAFAIPSHYTGLVRINLRGREPLGSVEPGVEYDSLLDRLEADLRAVVDAETGRPAVERVTRSANAFGGGPPPKLPDLFVEWRLSGVQRLVHPRITLRPRRLGLPRANLHSRTGLAMAAGPAVHERGDRGELSPTDVAPLLLSLLGEPPAAGASARGVEAFASSLVR